MRVDWARTPVGGGKGIFSLIRYRVTFGRCNRSAFILETETKLRLPLRNPTLSFLSLLILTFARSAQQTQPEPPAAPILGFSPHHAAAEHQIESAFQSIPSPDKARQWHRTFTAEPHPAASDRNNYLPDFIAAAWRKQCCADVTLRP